MKHFGCQKALNGKLDEYSKRKKIRIAYPNIKFEPKVTETWLKLFYLPTVSENITFGYNHEQIQGIMQIDIFTPYDTGTLKAYTIAEELQDIFKLNSAIRTEEGNVRITGFDTTNLQEDGWFRIMCEIHYTSFN